VLTFSALPKDPTSEIAACSRHYPFKVECQAGKQKLFIDWCKTYQVITKGVGKQKFKGASKKTNTTFPLSSGGLGGALGTCS